MKDAKGHGSDPRGAHAEGVNQIGQPKLNSQGLPHVDQNGNALPDTGRVADSHKSLARMKQVYG